MLSGRSRSRLSLTGNINNTGIFLKGINNISNNLTGVNVISQEYLDFKLLVIKNYFSSNSFFENNII